jgi:hypothetical protein
MVSPRHLKSQIGMALPKFVQLSCMLHTLEILVDIAQNGFAPSRRFMGTLQLIFQDLGVLLDKIKIASEPLTFVRIPLQPCFSLTMLKPILYFRAEILVLARRY